MADTKRQYLTYAEFWPYYLRQHSKAQTRYLHFIGTILAMASIIKAIVSFKIGWFFAAPVIAYAFAWVGHVFVEQNQPATFEHPQWSIRADFEMLGLWLTGELGPELQRNQIDT